VLKAIGARPSCVCAGRRPADADVISSWESVNPTGSYKRSHGRSQMIEGGRSPGALRPGMARHRVHRRHTGCFIGDGLRGQGYPFVVLSSDAFGAEKLRTMEAFGADLRMVPSDGGKVTAALLRGSRTDCRGLRANQTPSDRSVSERGCRSRLHGHRSRADCSRRAEESTRSDGRRRHRRDAYAASARPLGGKPAGRARIIAARPSSSPALSKDVAAPIASRGSGTGSVAGHMADRPYDEAAQHR